MKVERPLSARLRFGLLGVGFLLASPTAMTLVANRPAGAQPVAIETMALSGKAAPDAGGRLYKLFSLPVVNVHGEVTFQADLVNVLSDDHKSDRGVWSGVPGEVGLVARKGDPAPGTAFPYLHVGNFLNSATGEVVVAGAISAQFTSPSGVWLGDPASPELLLLEGDSAPGIPGHTFWVVRGMALNPKGNVAIRSSLKPSGWGIWTGEVGNLSLVADTDDVAPGTGGSTFSVFHSQVLSPQGVVGFRAGLSPSGGGIFSGTPGAISKVALAGEVAPDTGGLFLTTFGSHVINGQGQVAFSSTFSPAATGENRGIWVATPDANVPPNYSFATVMLLGEPAPGAPGRTFRFVLEPTLNAHGEVAFVAFLDTSDGTNNEGVWAGPPGSVVLVARKGSVAPGTGGRTFNGFGPVSMNSKGEVAFFASLDPSDTTNRVGIWAGKLGDLKLIVRSGDSIEVMPGDFRMLNGLVLGNASGNEDGLASQFSDRGHLAFLAFFDDSTQAILVALPPVLTSHKDSFLQAGNRNANEGANPVLMVRGADDDNDEARNAVVAFSPDTIDGFMNGPGLTSAKLVLTIAGRPDDWEDHGRVNAYPLLEEFIEGNGKRLGVPWGVRTRGDSEGVTWYCPVDEDISNRRRDCDQRWRGGDYDRATADPVRHRDRMRGEVMWDVTDDVLSGYSSWLIKPTSREAEGRVSYYSKEGAAEEGDPDLAPRLILE